MKHALTKWNSRLIALAAGGISTLATTPDLPHDIRAIGIVLVTVTGLLMIALRDILGPSARGRASTSDEALHDLGLDHAPPSPSTGDLPPN